MVVHNQVVAPAHITTVAGTATSGNGGDGGPATAARLFAPQGLAVDAAGNLYIADTNNDRIRRIDTSGVITTAAGSGLPGFSGDGGSATAIALQNPRFVALDAFGNLHLSEFGGSRVRRLNVAAKELFVIQSSGYVLAHLEFHEGRLPADLSDVTLSAVDSAGQPVSSAFPNSIVLPESGNPRKRVFHFRPDAGLLTGAGLRLDGRLASDGRRFSSDCARRSQSKCEGGR